jgi:hypothetical protein
MGSITICHCSDVELTKDQSALLAEKWQSCLCHQCLIEFTSPEDSKVLDKI